MKLVSLVCCLSLFCLMAGCVENSTVLGDPPAGELKTGDTETDKPSQTTENGAQTTSDAETMGQKIDLTPQNTSVEFVCAHTDPQKPDPRHGTFQAFNGTAFVDQTLMSVQIDIETASLNTEIDKLTDHLKGRDFFDVLRFPQARFESTKIIDQGDGTVQITGDLTMLDQTNSIAFPATINVEGEFTLEAKFDIDRTRWGMNFGTDKVEKLVELTIKIGK